MTGVRASLTRHLPGYSLRSLIRLGEGLDNVAYEVNGELIVRASKEADPARRREATRREADLLAKVAELSPLPVPEVAFADAEAGVLAYVKLPGVPLLGNPVAEPERLAPALGEFLHRLHRAPVEAMEPLAPRDTDPLTAWLDEAAGDYRAVAGHVPAADRRLVESFLGRPPPSDPDPEAVAFCHNDLGAEHVLVDVEAGTVTGVIDWSDAALTDPARDLARIYRDLGAEVVEATLARYRGRWGDAERERSVFYARCAVIEDLAHGVRTGAARYTEAALAHLHRTFT